MITGTWMEKENCLMGRLTRKQTTSRPDNVWPDMWMHMSDAAKKKAKQKWAIEKPKLDNAKGLRGIFFKELRHIIKNARRKLEIPMPASMPYIIQHNMYREKLLHSLTTQDEICLYCGGRRIYEDTHGKVSKQEP